MWGFLLGGTFVRIILTIITLALIIFGAIHTIQDNTQPESIAKVIDSSSFRNRSVQHLTSISLFKQSELASFKTILNEQESTEETKDQEDTIKMKTIIRVWN